MASFHTKKSGNKITWIVGADVNTDDNADDNTDDNDPNHNNTVLDYVIVQIPNNSVKSYHMNSLFIKLIYFIKHILY